MTEICMGFEVHQPLRLDRNFDIEEAKGKSPEELFDTYFDNERNQKILDRVSEKCYLPANETILKNIKRYENESKKFKVAYSISGTLILQLKRWRPDVLDSFKKLAKSDQVEFLNQTFYHSLASLFSGEKEEFIDQVLMHREATKETFGQDPDVFENTEFLYNNSIGSTLAEMGYKGVFSEGTERILGWRSPNHLYKAEKSDIRVLLRNYRLSDDIAFRFSNSQWEGWPLNADKYASWLSATPGDFINIFIDYETFGEHQWSETGIFDFLSWLPGEILKYQNLRFATPSEITKKTPVGTIDVNEFDSVSWADISRSSDAWLGNSMQRSTYRRIKNLKDEVKETGNEKLLEIWRLLQISDHLYYMYTTPGTPKEVHSYFSQQNPIEAYRTFNDILLDFEEKVQSHLH